MKVICINNSQYEIHLTINKSYEVVSSTPDGYEIKCDDGYDITFYKHRFITIKEYRDNKLNQILTR